MKKVRQKLVIVFLFTLFLYGCGEVDNLRDTINQNDIGKTDIIQEEEVKEKAKYPQIVYINNISYYGTGEVCEIVPRKSPDGVIETFVPEEIMPDAPNSANFGKEQNKLEYIILEDKRLIVHIGEKWHYFEKNEG